MSLASKQLEIRQLKEELAIGLSLSKEELAIGLLQEPCNTVELVRAAKAAA